MIKYIDDEKIYELYIKGLSHKEIANILNYGTSTVTRHLIDMGIRRYNIDKNEVVYLHEAGLYDDEIANLVGCTRSNITIILNRLGYINRKSKVEDIELRNRISNSLIGRYVGENNPNYKGISDITTLARGIFKTYSKQMIRNNDFTCFHCKKRGGNLETHHIKPFSVILSEFISNTYDGNISNIYEQLMNYDDFINEDNLIVLCHSCHHKVHYTDNHELSPYRWKSATTIESEQ